jgi:hypothetical protein
MRGYMHQNRPQDERESFRHYAKLCESEPQLAPLLLEVMREQPTTVQFYRKIKPKLMKLAGWSAVNPGMKTSDAYDTVYEVLCSLVYDP